MAKTNMSRTSTMKDVARHAGVSIATVSRFVNGAQRFRAETETRLRASIDALGFSVDPVARSMITGRTNTIAVVILDIRNPHFTGIVKGANRKAQQLGFDLLFVDTAESQSGEAHLLRALSKRVDGLIVSSRLPESALSTLAQLNKPVVFFGKAARLGVHSVSTDGRAAAVMLARHLLDLGHKTIAYLGYRAARWDAERRSGISDMLDQAGLKPLFFEVASPTLEAGEQAVSDVLMSATRPDAVICYNDLVAMGFMSQAQAAGVQIPQQLSVTGFDDIPFARYTAPPLTTVDMRSEAMGELALTRLVDAVNGRLNPSDEVLRPQLVLRQSTARRPSNSLE
jgi:DNA-binding LacI/PurR family transcriptional regulator